ncbi:MAG: hypothetical protein ABJF11_19495 [Reichenbachiella sp.]|uniref:hypothetical protein n=1 Tax=Reichenbachiella sp. TaxID=2184521 RepID=UPI0032632B49
MKKTLIIFSMCLLSSFGYAQEKLLITQTGETLTVEDLDEVAFVPSGVSQVSNPVSKINLTSTIGETLAAANIGFQFGKLGLWSGNVEIASPTASSGNTNPIGLDGLASDGKITLGLQFKNWKALTTNEIIGALTGYKDKDGKQVTSFVEIASDDDKRKILNKLKQEGKLKSPWFVGGTFTINQQDFKYATDNTLSTIMSEDEITVNFSLYGGFYVGKNINSLMRAIVLRKNSFNANPTNDYFTPFNGGPTLIKQSLSIGAPSESEETEISVENVTAWEGVGINPSVTYLVNAETWSFNLPIYLMTGKKGEKALGLNAGVYLNYLTDADDHFTAGLFIGSSLSDILRPKN